MRGQSDNPCDHQQVLKLDRIRPSPIESPRQTIRPQSCRQTAEPFFERHVSSLMARKPLALRLPTRLFRNISGGRAMGNISARAAVAAFVASLSLGVPSWARANPCGPTARLHPLRRQMWVADWSENGSRSPNSHSLSRMQIAINQPRKAAIFPPRRRWTSRVRSLLDEFELALCFPLVFSTRQVVLGVENSRSYAHWDQSQPTAFGLTCDRQTLIAVISCVNAVLLRSERFCPDQRAQEGRAQGRRPRTPGNINGSRFPDSRSADKLASLPSPRRESPDVVASSGKNANPLTKDDAGGRPLQTSSLKRWIGFRSAATVNKIS